MPNKINVAVKCPSCGKSLINSDIRIDDFPSIDITAKVGDKSGRIYLSQIYGSYNKKFEGIEDIPGIVVDCSCPKCLKHFPIRKICECNAPVVTLQLEVGGMVNFCTRNGCPHHSVEFNNLNDAWSLFQCKDEIADM
jgi:hypothetical protein